MPKKSHKDEKQVLDYIFRENSTLEKKEQEKNINTYYAIKHHMPSEIFKSGKLNFSYNKALTYILASFEDIQLFKIPNNDKNLVELACPPDREFVKTLKISDTKKDATIKRYRDTKAKIWYIKFTPEEVLCFTSNHWKAFSALLLDISKGN